MPKATASPVVAPSATPATNATEAGIARSEVTRTIADMIWGPAIIVIASGST